MTRGSRKHVLDWTESPKFAAELLELVRPVEARINERSTWMPKGHGASIEARLETFGPRALPESDAWPRLREWWLAHERRGNTPNWDIAAGCEIEGRTGLILVEAKANVTELSRSGKPLSDTASDSSRANHERIGQAIDEARAALRRFAPTTISRDSHYQLANRVAFTWKLASLGVPTVLVYLGFLGDHGLAAASKPFRDETHWNESFAAYARSTVPRELFERRLDCAAAPAWLFVRSRNVREDSVSGASAPGGR